MDRVLDPSFAEGIESLDNDDLRARREEVRLEERDISYIRRLLQGRLDLLRDDLTKRRGGGGQPAAHQRSDPELVEDLTHALAETRSTARSEHLVDVEAPDHNQRRRAAEVAVDDVRLSDPTALDDDELAGIVARMEDLEHRASATRRSVLLVLDAFNTEIQRRVVEGEMSPDADISRSG